MVRGKGKEEMWREIDGGFWSRSRSRKTNRRELECLLTANKVGSGVELSVKRMDEEDE